MSMMRMLSGLAAVGLLTTGAAAQDRTPQRGNDLFQLWCSGCHAPLSARVPSVAGTSSLERRYKGAKPAALEQRTDLTPDYIRYILRHGTKSMPFFRKTELRDADVDALAAYLNRTDR